MKNKILGLALSFGLWPLTGQASPSTQENQVLRAIDDICGDTWCEGSFNYRFQRVEVDQAKKRAEVLFEMSTDVSYSFQIASEKPVRAQVLNQSFAVSCQIEGISEPSDMLSGTHSLRWDVYISLNDCISSLEGKFLRILRQ